MLCSSPAYCFLLAGVYHALVAEIALFTLCLAGFCPEYCASVHAEKELAFLEDSEVLSNRNFRNAEFAAQFCNRN